MMEKKNVCKLKHCMTNLSLMVLLCMLCKYRGEGGWEYCHTYIHVFYLGYIGMTAVKGMVFKQFTLG